ncbi:MAG TPA: hypothetical protein VHW65_03335 [Gemmatimonadales bacterium]|nr:hypothetical protein [Gemmatimonadales bacterium]
MNRKYWLKVLAGVVGIFVLGLLVMRGVRAGVQHAKTSIASTVGTMTSKPGLFDVGFRVDGDSLGTVRRLQLLRSTPRRTDSAVMTVQLQDAALMSRVSGCHLALESTHHFNRSTSFTCADVDDSASMQLVRFGHVVVDPGHVEVPLFVPREQLASFQHENPGVSNVGDTGDVDIQSQSGHFSVNVNGHEVVSIEGDSASGSGSVVVRDSHGVPIIEISGDKDGGSVKVRDSTGRTRVDIGGKNSKPAGGP